MKHTMLWFVVLLFAAGCGTEVANNAHPGPGQHAAGGNKQADAKTQEIDIDSLDIPQRMKDAIKSGKIPKERVQQFLAMRKQEAPLVVLSRVAERALHAHTTLSGTIESQRQVPVYARLSSYVTMLKAEESDKVVKGQVLALLDDREIRINLNQAELQMQQAKLGLEEETFNFKRNQELRQKELISEKEFQTSKVTYEQAELEYKNKLEAHKYNQLQLSYCSVTAPISGYITERLIEVGSKVSVNEHLYTVEDFHPLLVRVYVPAAESTRLQKGMQADITSEDLPGQVFTGKVKLINPRIDVQTGTVRVTVEVTDKQEKLTPGMFVEVNIITSQKQGLAVPQTAVRYIKGEPHVYIFKRGMVFETPIQTGLSQGAWLEVTQGLTAGDAIVSQGTENLHDKQPVKIKQ